MGEYVTAGLSSILLFVAVCVVVVAMAYGCANERETYNQRFTQCVAAGGSWIPTNTGNLCIIGNGKPIQQ